MGTPADHLPQPISDNAINQLLLDLGLPRATKIQRKTVTAEYHGIYFIVVPPNNITEHTSLILRVSGNHLPRIKTENEVGVMRWVRANTAIPIPAIVAYDSTIDNVLGYEYTLMSCMPGKTLSDVYPSLSSKDKYNIVGGLIDILLALHRHRFDAIGGLYIDSDGGNVKVGRIVDETFWQIPDIQRFWPEVETVDSLNIGGPYASYAELIAAQIRLYVRLMQLHTKLEFMRDLVPRLEQFAQAILETAPAAELNRVNLRLAHKDLHFGNVLYDTDSKVITAILDWEFSGVVPFFQWNPRKAFLWNGRYDAASGEEKAELYRVFEERCNETGLGIAKEAEPRPLQECVQNVADFLRAITEVAPREQRKGVVQSWKETMLVNMERFYALKSEL